MSWENKHGELLYYLGTIEQLRGLILAFRSRLKNIELTDKGLVMHTDDVGYQQPLEKFYDEFFNIKEGKL